MFRGIQDSYTRPTLMQRLGFSARFVVGERVFYHDSTNDCDRVLVINNRRFGTVNSSVLPQWWYSGTLYELSSDRTAGDYFTTITNANQKSIRKLH